MSDVFRECRERVTAQDAARRYGMRFDRRGWAVCPFHADVRPSMSFRAGRFRCWACGASGDAVDFTGRLGLEPMAAMERLNADFALSLPIRRTQTAAETQAVRRRIEIAKEHKEFEEWRGTMTAKLCAAYQTAHTALKNMEEWDKLTGPEALDIRWQSCFEYWADTLDYGSPEEQAQLDRERGAISQWTGKVLKS